MDTPAEKIENGSETHELSKTTSDEFAVTWTAQEEKKVRNKLDWQIVPMVTVLYLMCFLGELVRRTAYLSTGTCGTEV